MKKYVEIPKNDVDSKVENAWFGTCRKNNIPFITLKSRTKLADVHWDYISYPTEVDRILKGLDGQLRDGAIAIFKKYADSRSEYTANDLLVWFKNLEIPKAKLAAEELYDLVAGYVERNRKSNQA
ncbi:hypothetical protein LLG90_25925 [Aromatoleum toluclasticum]|uniref:hypothetical protein n=1 Tax=Aromatoleum toluclasticum TaxID=92003 RepID=UPI001D19290A|nr:hypothetical protein [Aromatoleum toluclasticum]MCC4118796.1 hypothetical protein [Aromatoleum toluclasticum]